MGSYFLDTSAIVKRYFPEQGHTWVVTLCDPEQAHSLYISQAALVEVVATVCRKAREQSIADEERDALIKRFRQDSQNAYNSEETLFLHLRGALDPRTSNCPFRITLRVERPGSAIRCRRSSAAVLPIS